MSTDHKSYHLAQFNIIKLKDELDSPIIAEFKDFLEPVNEWAEGSPGFIWRLKDEGGGSATGVETPYEDRLIFINMSVWHRLEDLENYVFRTVHSYFLKNRAKWGVKLDGNQSVLWWIPAGEIPTVEDGKAKLKWLNSNGSSAEAFSMRDKYGPNGLKL